MKANELQNKIKLANSKREFMALAIAIKEDPCISSYHQNRVRAAMLAQTYAGTYDRVQAQSELTRQVMLSAVQGRS